MPSRRKRRRGSGAHGGAASHPRGSEIPSSSASRELDHVMSTEDPESGGRASAAAATATYSHSESALRDDTGSRAAGVPYVPAGTKRRAGDDDVDYDDDMVSRKRARSSAGVHTSQPIVLVKIGADGHDSRIPIMYDALTDMDRMALLRSLKADDAFAVKLRDVPLDDCTVWLLPRVAGDEPTPQEEATAVELRAAATIGELLSTNMCTPSRLLFLRVRMPEERDTTTLPDHIQFDEHPAGGLRMMRALVRGKAGKEYPFFLPQAALTELRDFVEEAPSDTPQILLLTGPVKSGKTTVLHHVLPALIADAHRAGLAPQPVILRFAFNLRARPDEASVYLVQEAARIAKRAGLHAPEPSTSNMTSQSMGSTLGEFAREVRARGRRLWLLLDEMQAPLLACDVVHDAEVFTASLKDLVGECAPYARIAMTGSGMVTFLNHVRLVPVNGFEFQAAARTVVLGETPTTAAASAMASDILSAHACHKKWSKLVQDGVEPAAFVSRLDADDMLSRRPAVVAYVAGLMGDARRGAPADVLANAVNVAHRKLWNESAPDFVTALQVGDGDIRRALYALAAGDLKTYLKYSGTASGSRAAAFLSSLCEPAPPDAVSGPLLRPYDTLTKLCLNNEGVVLVEWASQRMVLSHDLRSLLNFFVETFKKRVFSDKQRNAISDAVLRTLADNRIKGLSAAADVMSVPELARLLKSQHNSGDYTKHAKMLRDADYSATIGLHIMRWWRNVASHDPSDAAVTLYGMGFSPALINTAVHAAVKALVETPDGPSRTWVRNSSGPPQLVGTQMPAVAPTAIP